jgi:hypothetical protein
MKGNPNPSFFSSYLLYQRPDSCFFFSFLTDNLIIYFCLIERKRSHYKWYLEKNDVIILDKNFLYLFDNMTNFNWRIYIYFLYYRSFNFYNGRLEYEKNRISIRNIKRQVHRDICLSIYSSSIWSILSL